MYRIAKDILKNESFRCQKASLTVEAALVMPLFLYFMIAFLYFIQIFTVQEQIQAAITRMGLNWSKATYFYKDFPDLSEALSFDKTVFGNEMDNVIDDITDQVISGSSLKLYAMGYLDKEFVNKSCIQDGFNGIDFFYSSVINQEDCIDIVLKYRVSIPIEIFSLGDMNILQRIRVRSWTGYEVKETYTTEEATDTTMVYITATGTVYHKSQSCSHIKLSVIAVQGIPVELRNESGSKYTSCDKCCTGKEGDNMTYYITSYGTKYHLDRNCSRIKRSVQEIPVSEAGDRKPCTRCYKIREED